jgi:hypothetical protein
LVLGKTSRPAVMAGKSLKLLKARCDM